MLIFQPQLELIIRHPSNVSDNTVSTVPILLRPCTRLLLGIHPDYIIQRVRKPECVYSLVPPNRVLAGNHQSVGLLAFGMGSESPRIISQSESREWHVNLSLHHAPEAFSTEGFHALGAVAVDGQTESLFGKRTE